MAGINADAQIKNYNEYELQEDFKVFRGNLEDLHPGFYWYRSTQEIDSTFEVAAAKRIKYFVLGCIKSIHQMSKIEQVFNKQFV